MNSLSKLLQSDAFKNSREAALNNKHGKVRSPIRPLLKPEVQYVAILDDVVMQKDVYVLTFTIIEGEHVIPKSFRLNQSNYNTDELLGCLVTEEDRYYDDAKGRPYIIVFTRNKGKDGRVYDNLSVCEMIPEDKYTKPKKKQNNRMKELARPDEDWDVEDDSPNDSDAEYSTEFEEDADDE